ncbi:Filamentation induced by cAMP protein [Bifidobacterium saguini DSM 23967]|uniref:Filamentation induced by cAMP protein n=2 Tax=Bifidobacterium saguini TaxID=762210 RepID=A0A087D5Q5_9BIFI|nr:Fic family protein [Bifidobacterium saguini]KFI90855.1 Filamentation induced by cAMP protein [Bifidobacterium saguini DSM 23967]QTB90731.1 Fic family protein [Bifidobacterium saguini]
MPGRQRLVERMLYERDHRIQHSLFYWTQIFMSYNSNHMEGSTLTAEQTAQIYETGRFLADKSGEQISIDDAVETANHFDAFNYILDHADDPVDERMVRELHTILKRGTSDSRSGWKNVGGYKTHDNEITQILGVTSVKTAPAGMVPQLMEEVFDAYARLDDNPVRIAQCHWMFEKVHPFSDGNGRVGRLVMFKECLRLDTVPPLIRDERHNQYTRGLDLFPQEPGWLVDLILSERDAYQRQFIEHMAAGEIHYSYNDAWKPEAHRDELEQAEEFERRIADQWRDDSTDDLFGMYGMGHGADDPKTL